jgi:nitrogen fixation protein NifZ
VRGETLVAAGAVGEVLKVIWDKAGQVSYHVHFDALPGRVLQIPEATLDALGEKEHAGLS